MVEATSDVTGNGELRAVSLYSESLCPLVRFARVNFGGTGRTSAGSCLPASGWSCSVVDGSPRGDF